jgi:hypothetical protein
VLRISDTTILSALAYRGDLTEHVTMQLPLALAAVEPRAVVAALVA